MPSRRCFAPSAASPRRTTFPEQSAAASNRPTCPQRATTRATRHLRHRTVARAPPSSPSRSHPACSPNAWAAASLDRRDTPAAQVVSRGPPGRRSLAPRSLRSRLDAEARSTPRRQEICRGGPIRPPLGRHAGRRSKAVACGQCAPFDGRDARRRERVALDGRPSLTQRRRGTVDGGDLSRPWARRHLPRSDSAAPVERGRRERPVAGASNARAADQRDRSDAPVENVAVERRAGGSSGRVSGAAKRSPGHPAAGGIGDAVREREREGTLARSRPRQKESSSRRGSSRPSCVTSSSGRSPLTLFWARRKNLRKRRKHLYGSRCAFERSRLAAPGA